VIEVTICSGSFGALRISREGRSVGGSAEQVVRFMDLPREERPAAHFGTRELAVLDAVNRRLAGAPSLEEAIDFLFESTRSILPCDRIGIAFVDESGLRVSARYAVADYEPLQLGAGYSEDLQGSSLRDVLDRGVPRIITDLQSYLAAHPGSRSTELVVREGVRSSLTCPLSVDGRQVGLLFRSSRQANAYGEREVRLHLALAERLGQTVEKAYRIAQLEEANRAYLDMLGFVSHELKNPVASVLLNAKLMRSGTLGSVTGEQGAKLDGIVANCEHLLSLIREYLDLARIEEGGLGAEFVPVDDFAGRILEPAAELCRPLISHAGMTVQEELPEEAVALDGDPELLRIALVNLIGNAARYGRRGGRIVLKVRRERDAVLAAVWNEGPGFTEEEGKRLFRRFVRLEADEALELTGSGVGLYTAWRIAQLHSGRITAESEPGRWAEFSVWLPQAPQG
jgi:signal transduction histidine kinase